MKNISRRVFIKGLAVAGVAAAASTVLAGCNTNMLPGTDNGTDEPAEDVTPGNAQTITWADQAESDKKLTMKITNVVKNELDQKLVLYVEVTNNLGKTIVLNGTAVSGKEYAVKPTFAAEKADGNALTAPTLCGDATTGVDNLFVSTSQVEVADGKTRTGVLVIEGVNKDWVKLTTTLTFAKYTTAAVTSYDVVKFDLTNK